MPQAITIDNFPVEASIHWAKSQNEVRPSQEAQEAKTLLPLTEIVVSTPSYDHLTLLFEENKRAPTWAFLLPPPYFYQQSNRFFQQTLMKGVNASLLIERYQAHIDILHEQGLSLCPVASQKVLRLFELLESLDTLLGEIRSKMLMHRKI